MYSLPLKLSFFHIDPPLQIYTLNMYRLITAAILFFTIYGLFFSKNKNTKMYAGLIGIILVSISPTLSPVQVAWMVAERYMYLGSIFFIILLVKIITENDYLQRKDLVTTVLIIVGTFYAVRTHARSYIWKNSKTVWEATEKTAYNSPRIYNNLGDVYSNEKDYVKAVEYFTKATELNPNYSDAHHNLGYTYALLNDYENAKKHLEISLQQNPNLYQAAYKLAIIAHNEGDVGTTYEYLNQTLEINPNFEPAIEALEKLQSPPVVK